ncbi:MAG: hypothetical protein WB778_02610 [Thermoplasmata archaeon]
MPEEIIRSKLLAEAPTPLAARIVGSWPAKQTATELRARSIAVLEVLVSETRGK